MKIIIFSSLPPPIGGVTRSVENLLRALSFKHITTAIMTQRPSLKPLFSRYDIAHIHYSRSWKRFLGLLLGKLVSKKVIFTLHGNHYDQNMLNNMCAKLADGVVLLNQNSETKYKNHFKNTKVLDSIFAEGVKTNTGKGKVYIDRSKEKTYLLVYAFDKRFINSKEVYGVDFMLKNISKLDDKYRLVLLDIKGAYKEDVEKLGNDTVVYLDFEVDFTTLLQEIDIYVRPTSTDGSSVAVQEALMLGKNVLASDVVERPNGVILYEYENFQDFQEKLIKIDKKSNDYVPNSIDEYLLYCQSLLK